MLVTTLLIPLLLQAFVFLMTQLWQSDTPYITQTVNYYTVEKNYSAELLNSARLNIIAENDCIVRIKPDRSSAVVAHLPIGRVVQATDKYRKWIQIVWSDETGASFLGWVQNYRLESF